MFGLADALARKIKVSYQLHSIQQPLDLKPLFAGVPDLIIAAGHRTHWRALYLKRRLKAPVCVLMKPTLPRWLFDFCIVPKHDGWRDSQRVFTTFGALNRVRPLEKTLNSGLILLGGPARHAQWDSQAIAEQVRAIVAEDNQRHWTIADSRRTPEDLLAQFEDLNVSRMPWQSCPNGWLVQALGEAARVWVTPDSVSMVYEALSGGCEVGLLDLPMRHTRVARGMKDLIAARRVMTFAERHQPWPVPNVLREADRAAQWLLERLS